MTRRRQRSDALGDGLTWLCGGALALNLLLVIGLLAILSDQGLRYFWQKPLVEVATRDGRRLLGEIEDGQTIPGSIDSNSGAPQTRTELKVGNRDVTGVDFVWIDDAEIKQRSEPPDAALLERYEWGNFYGRLVEVQNGGRVLGAGSQDAWSALRTILAEKRAQRAVIEHLEKKEIGKINREIEELRLATRKLALSSFPEDERRARASAIEAESAERTREYQGLADRLTNLRKDLVAEMAILETSDGTRKSIPVGQIVRAIQPNKMTFADRVGLYATRVWEFVSDEPRESNTEGGIFPAIFGTVMMVFLMTIVVVPFGVLAALYLREYARQGAIVRVVRIAVHNLAGVPSIVFGMFGLGFFVYLIGGTIDRLFFAEALPAPTYGTGGILWASLTLALLTVPVVIVATEEGLAAVPRIVREGSLALGATKFETTWHVVVPAAAPGILTGMILAMARAAGEVAPLMIVGMVKLAPDLPVDGTPPFVHFDRKFMHLGFHIYDVGFQSPNVDATKPVVFATALLLIVVVTAMNLVAIGIRNHLRRKYAGSAV